MISFIIIGKNEGWKLTKCFESVFNFISVNNILNYEVIYIDSKSTDDSIERVNLFHEIKIFQITGICNAAIARNIGANESIGDILFFIDGDMEIQSDFYINIFDENFNLKYDFVSGDFLNLNYDSNWYYINQNKYFNLQKDEKQYTTGGIFVIKRDLWFNVYGMKTKFRINEDVDFGFRLAKKGYYLIRLKNIIAIHHTIPYNDLKRKFDQLLIGNEFYPSVLLRDHLNNFQVYLVFLKENYTLIIFMILLFLNIFLYLPVTLFTYLFVLLCKSYKSNNSFDIGLFYNLIYFFLRDISRFFALLFFWPKSHEVHYKNL